MADYRIKRREGVYTSSEGDMKFKANRDLSGAEAGRAARMDVLDRMIRRRQMLKRAQEGSPGGRVTPRGFAPTSAEVESMIQPRGRGR